jgi:hypothetical protein
MNRLIQQLQLEAKMGDDFGNVHETREANEFVAEIAVHGPPHRTRVKDDARILLATCTCSANRKIRRDKASCQNSESKVWDFTTDLPKFSVGVCPPRSGRVQGGAPGTWSRRCRRVRRVDAFHASEFGLCNGVFCNRVQTRTTAAVDFLTLELCCRRGLASFRRSAPILALLPS